MTLVIWTTFIHKEDEKYKTPPDLVADLFVLFILSEKPWDVQAMTMLSRRLKTVHYYRWMIVAATIPDYFIDVDVLGMLKDTWKVLLQGKHGK